MTKFANQTQPLAMIHKHVGGDSSICPTAQSNRVATNMTAGIVSSLEKPEIAEGE